MPSREGFIRVCREADLTPGQGRAVRVGGREVALFRVRGRIYALENTCPHAGGPLAAGTVVDDTITCSWHCAAFDLETGASLDSISRWDADVYPVEVRDGWVSVGVGVEDVEVEAE